MPFRLTEYDRAFAEFFIKAARELAIAREPLLENISFERTPSALGSVIEDRQGGSVDLPAGSITAEGRMQIAHIRAGDLVELIVAIDAFSKDIADGYARHVVSTLNTVTAATGKVFHAAGRLNFDVFLEALEAYEWSLTDDDKLALPTLIMNPADVDKFPPLTEDQKARLSELHERKLKELLASRRRRRLS